MNSATMNELDISNVQLDAIISSLYSQISKLYNIEDDQPLMPIRDDNLDNVQMLNSLCSRARKHLLAQPMLLEIDLPINICGDIHGQFNDLLLLFEIVGRPPTNRYLFLGDYVDRGRSGLEVIVLLLALMLRYPNSFYLTRGNHECRWISRVYGFQEEITTRFGSPMVWEWLMTVFDCLPAAAIVDGAIFCVHGGISPHLHSLNDIRCLKRPTEVPGYGLLCDLMWSDPTSNEHIVFDWANNHRQVSYTFGQRAVAKFCWENNIVGIVRAHQSVDGGYRVSSDGRVITIFSAPNYCGQCNDGCVMQITAQRQISMILVRQREPPATSPIEAADN